MAGHKSLFRVLTIGAFALSLASTHCLVRAQNFGSNSNVGEKKSHFLPNSVSTENELGNYTRHDEKKFGLLSLIFGAATPPTLAPVTQPSPTLIFIYPPAQPAVGGNSPPPSNPTPSTPPTSRNIAFSNKCGFDVWLNPAPSGGSPAASGVQRVPNNGIFTYNIPDAGWTGRFWPKFQCDVNGQNCAVGESQAPCPAAGCEPASDTTVVFSFPPSIDDTRETFYDINLINGYSIPVSVAPSSNVGGSCASASCNVSLSRCPSQELDVGDLRIIKGGKVVQCLSPCEKWSFASPVGLGRPVTEEPGQSLCCVTPPISPFQCRSGPVVNTQYVTVVHNDCPAANGYVYDSANGLHSCPTGTSFQVVFCPFH